MSVTWAFVFHHPGADPDSDRHELEGGGMRALLVPVADPAQAPEVARRLVDEHGAGLVELCGAFTTTEAARVIDEIGTDAAVGHTTFGREAVGPLAALFGTAPTAPSS